MNNQVESQTIFKSEKIEFYANKKVVWKFFERKIPWTYEQGCMGSDWGRIPTIPKETKDFWFSLKLII